MTTTLRGGDPIVVSDNSSPARVDGLGIRIIMVAFVLLLLVLSCAKAGELDIVGCRSGIMKKDNATRRLMLVSPIGSSDFPDWSLLSRGARRTLR